MNNAERETIIRELANNDPFYKNNPDALKNIKKALEEVELMQNGELPKKTGREFLEELKKEQRKRRVQESYNKLIEKNGEALRRLSKV